MKDPRRTAVIFVIPLILGLTTVFRITPDIRAVDFLKIFAGGMLFGVGLMGILQPLRKKTAP